MATFIPQRPSNRLGAGLKSKSIIPFAINSGTCGAMNPLHAATRRSALVNLTCEARTNG